MLEQEDITFDLKLRRGEVLRYWAVDRFLRARFTWILVLVCASLFLLTTWRGQEEPLWQAILEGIVAYPALLLLLWMVNALAVVFQIARMFKGAAELNEGKVDVDATRIKVSGRVNSFECRWTGVVIFQITNRYLFLYQPNGIEIMIPSRLLSQGQIAAMRTWWQVAQT